MALAFYHGHGSPYSWRVFLALEHLGIAYDLKLLSFTAGDTRKPEFVALNPRHQVPTIVDEGFVLWESSAVLEYLDERFGAGKRLFPGDAKARARVRRLVCEATAYVDNEGISPITVEYFFKDGAPPDEAKVKAARETLELELRYFAGEVRGPYLAGDTLTAADFALYPHYAYVGRLTFRKPELELTKLVPDKLAQWGKRIEALPYFDKTYPPHWRG